MDHPPPLFKSVRSDEYAIKAIFLETLWLEEFRCVFNDGDLGVQLVSHDFSSMYIAICYFCSAPSNGEQWKPYFFKLFGWNTSDKCLMMVIWDFSLSVTILYQCILPSGIFVQRHLTVSSINDISIIVDSIIDDSQMCDRSSDVVMVCWFGILRFQSWFHINVNYYRHL